MKKKEIYIAEDGRRFATEEACIEHEDKLFARRQKEFSKRFKSVGGITCEMLAYVINDMFDSKVESFVCFKGWKKVYESCTAVERWEEIPGRMVNGKRYIIFKTDIDNSAKVIDPEELKKEFVREVDNWKYQN